MNIIGYSGHAYVCIENAQSNDIDVSGYFENNEKQNNPYSLKYLGKENEVDEFDEPLFIAVGDNHLRSEIYYQIISKKPIFKSLIHRQTIISSTAILEDNVLINAGVVVNAQTKIGLGAIINTGAVIEHECVIGDFVHIAPGAVLAGNVKVGKRTFIGANSVVKQGITIADDVIVGAGSVVINDIYEAGIYVGNPAKRIK